jgi:hypothetical protein
MVWGVMNSIIACAMATTLARLKYGIEPKREMAEAVSDRQTNRNAPAE